MKIKQVIENGLTYQVTVQDNGTKEWRLNGQRHREDGPAIEYTNGTKFWCKNGQFHREDGPTVEYADGTKLWYLNDKNYSEAQFKALFTITLFSGRRQNIHEIS